MQSDIAATFTESMRPQDSCRHTPAVVVGLPAIERAKIRADTMRTIPLTQGKFALVDDSDYEWLSHFKWYAHKQPRTYYATRQVSISSHKQRIISMHRAILSAPLGAQVDHCDGNGLNNQQSNLRICTAAENVQHQKKQRKGTSKYKGVCWHSSRHKWYTQIQVNKRHIHLGVFKSEIEAARTYDAAALKYHKQFALTNKMLGLL